MARLNGTFDPAAVSDDRIILPAGTYLAQIVASSLEITKSGSGSYIKLQWQIMDGDQNGRTVFQQITYENANAQAVEIGQREMKRLCEALGLGPVHDTEQLHLRPCLIKIKVRPGRVDQTTGKEYQDTNEVNGYAPASTPDFARGGGGMRTASPPVAPRPQPQPQPQPPRQVANGGGARPWKT